MPRLTGDTRGSWGPLLPMVPFPKRARPPGFKNPGLKRRRMAGVSLRFHVQLMPPRDEPHVFGLTSQVLEEVKDQAKVL
jgi:hypothetical protein